VKLEGDALNVNLMCKCCWNCIVIRGGIIKGQGGAKAPPTVFCFTFFSIYLKNNI